MTFKNKKIQKLISTLMIVAMFAPSLVFFSKPKKAEAQFVDPLNAVWQPVRAVFDILNTASNITDTGLSIKEVLTDIARVFLQRLARKFLQEMTTSTVNWINTGFHGQPLFIENAGSFFEDIAKSEVRWLVDTIGYDRLNFPFGRQTALGIIYSYKRQFEVNARYSLSKVINDPILLQRYRNDFNVGGWNGFLINTQYPQNNYLGFQILANEKLARELQGTSQSAAEKVRDKLQQGMGFLSPQTCPGNPEYNNDINEFNRPAFNYDAKYEPPEDIPFDIFSGEDVSDNIRKNIEQKAQYDAQYRAGEAAVYAEWAIENTCPGGLMTTTPGSVAANSIMEALGTTQRQGELSAAMGNSLSAIFDALTNHFMNQGLTALATKINPQPSFNDWSYEGNTLGSPNESGTNTTWNSGPDEEIILSDFKKRISGKTIIVNTNGIVIEEEIGNTGNGIYVSGDIVSTETELQLMYNESSNNPGIMQLLNQIWPQIRELDICLPGPDFGWEGRLEKERDRNSLKLQQSFSENDGKKAAEAQLVYNELKFAVSGFGDWVNNEMLTELPSSILYIDGVSEIKELGQQAKELVDKRRTKTQALARLKAIETSLAIFTTQPDSGSSEEKALILLKKQYAAIKNSISNTISIEDTRSELSIAKDQLDKFNELINKCTLERIEKGWSVPGGWSSTSGSNNEKAVFCDLPIKGGIDHKSFKHENDSMGILGAAIGVVNLITYPEIPYVNARNVFSYKENVRFGRDKKHAVNIELSCNLIFETNILDYKGSIPGLTTVTKPYEELPRDTTRPPEDSETGYCAYSEELIYADVETQEDCGAKGGSWIVAE